MAHLLRKLPDKDAWAEVSDSPLWENEDCPHQALVQVFDNRSGVSTWRVTSQEETRRVIVAQALVRSTVNDFAYCLIDEQALSSTGIKLKSTPQRTIDKSINDLHIDIVNLTGRQLISLARFINISCELKVMTRSDILHLARKYFLDGTFDREFLFTRGNKGRTEAEIATSKELLVHLWKKQDLGLS